MFVFSSKRFHSKSFKCGQSHLNDFSPFVFCCLFLISLLFLVHLSVFIFLVLTWIYFLFRLLGSHFYLFFCVLFNHLSSSLYIHNPVIFVFALFYHHSFLFFLLWSACQQRILTQPVMSAEEEIFTNTVYFFW
jgi:hypothetical protein